MKNFFKEFKEFAIKGNMIDIAIGVIIGTAFNKVVEVLVKDIIMPPISLLTDGVHHADKKIIIRDAGSSATGETIDELAIGYGKLIESLIDFMIIGLTVFVVIKIMNSTKRKAENVEDKTVETPKDIELLSKLTKLVGEQNEILKNRPKS